MESPGAFDPETTPFIKEVVSFLLFNKSIKDLVHALKYKNMPWVGEFMGEWMGIFIQNKFDNPLIIPVPLHKVKKRERGYNQSERIAAGLVKVTNWEMDEELLLRTIYTQTQTKMNKEERMENMESVFICLPGEDKERTILLLDDIYTTGSTVISAAKILSEAGYVDIRVVTVATPLFMGDQR